jgi:putative addiction module killer protein
VVVLKTAEFSGWYDALDARSQALVDGRLERIEASDAFGDVRREGWGVYELRWRRGLRVYFGYVRGPDGKAVLLLVGGTKHEQNQDIARARRIFDRETA